MKYNIHFISGTHWDREWYRPFQEFRFLLVELLDNLIKDMNSNPDFKYFHLDGQTCILKDYLEIRPEQYESLQKLISEGRILIGPWFTMPDLFCVSEEALIRNLLLGQRICEDFKTDPMKVGYTCDMFGHPAQMPLFYNEFEIDFCVLGRGTIQENFPAFFNWRTNNAKVFTFKLQDELGYGAFIQARNILENSNDKNDPSKIKISIDSIRKYLNHEIGRTNGKTICLMDAMDHKPPTTDIRFYFDLINKTRKDISVRHSNLLEFFNDAKITATTIPTFKGELRQPSKNRNPYNWLIPNCISARVRMKKKNDQCQNLLKFWVEPFLAFVNLEKEIIPNNFLNSCWKNLLLNHAHDSICGCSIDQVHKDMMYRYDQVEILGNQIKAKTLSTFCNSIKELSSNPDEFTIAVFNPLPYSVKEIKTLEIDFPLNYPSFFTEGFGGYGSQKIFSFEIFDDNKNKINYQLLNIIPQCQERTQLATFTSEGGDGIFSKYIIAAHIELPAFGYKTFLVKPSKTPIRNLGSLLTKPNEAENEFLILTINSNGTIDLFDKENKQLYKNILIFEDSSEIGSGWFHSQTKNEEIISSYCSQSYFSILHNGSLQITFKIVNHLLVPEAYDYSNETRTENKKELIIENFITLQKNKRHISIKTIIHNNVLDHKLSLLLPSEIKSDTYIANTQFDLTERKIEIDKSTATYQEVEVLQKPFQNFLYIKNQSRGLAFISSAGLHEAGIREDKSRTMEITLVRAFRRTVGTLGEKDGQEQGKIILDYSIYPFAGKKEKYLNDIFKIQNEIQTDLFLIQSGKLKSGFPKFKGKDSQFSIFELLNNKLYYSACKPSDYLNSIIIRLWNPSHKFVNEKIKFFKDIAEVKFLNFAEHEVNRTLYSSKYEVMKNILTIDVKKQTVITLKITFK